MFWKSKDERERERQERERSEDIQSKNRAYRREGEIERKAAVQELISFYMNHYIHIEQVLRSEAAIEGRALGVQVQDVFFSDVFKVTLNFARATGRFTTELGDLLLSVGSATLPRQGIDPRPRPINQEMHELNKKLKGQDSFNFWWSFCKDEKTSILQQSADVTVPLSVSTLVAFDRENGTSHARDAGKAFLRFVNAASPDERLSALRGDFHSDEAGKNVQAMYHARLAPSVQGSVVEDDSIGDETVCLECQDSYSALGLDAQATRDEVKTAYRDCAKIYHPDRFPEGDLRLRLRAEQEFKKVQQAYSHIVEHSPD